MNGWKVIAIIFIIIFILENLFIGYGMYLLNQDEENTMACYYDICAYNDDAYYDTDEELCTCYSIDDYGEYIEEDKRYLG